MAKETYGYSRLLVVLFNFIPV